jgi:hypothetical protein
MNHTLFCFSVDVNASQQVNAPPFKKKCPVETLYSFSKNGWISEKKIPQNAASFIAIYQIF